MRTRVICLIAFFIFAACATPIAQETAPAKNTSTPVVELPTPIPTLTITPIPTNAPTPDCPDAFQAPKSVDPSLLNFRAQQAQEFAQKIFETIQGKCPSANQNDEMEAMHFVIEFKITANSVTEITERFVIQWRLGNNTPVFQIYPARQFWAILRCRGYCDPELGLGENKEILSNKSITGYLIQYVDHAVLYLNNTPVDIVPVSGGIAPTIKFFTIADTPTKPKIQIDSIKMWKIYPPIKVSEVSEQVVLPSVKDYRNLNEVPPIPGSFGVSPHFLAPESGEARLISQAGFTHARCDMSWNVWQTSKGIDFIPPDLCFENLAREKISVSFLLGSNPAYQVPTFPYPKSFVPPVTDEARKAYAQFLEDVVIHYANKGIVWEVWGEPHRKDWWPNPNPKDYVKFLQVVIPVIRNNDPSGLIVAPNIDMLDDPFALSYIRAIGEAGLIDQLDAIGVHPYKTGGVFPNNTGNPEDAQKAYFQIRKIIDFYSPDRYIPIVSTEWGYDASVVGIEKKSKFLVRMKLSNMANDIPLSNWYDWRTYSLTFIDNGPIYKGLDWGIVDGKLDPLPGFYAIQNLAKTLNGFELLRRIPVENSKDFVLLFRKDNQAGLALWTTKDSHIIKMPSICEKPTAVDMYGKPYEVSVLGSELTINISDAPVYMICSEVNSDIIFWKPVHNIQSISIKNQNVLIRAINTSDSNISGKFILKSQFFDESEVQISIRPGQKIVIEIPVPVKAWRADIIPAQVDFINDDGSQQSAMLWLSIINNN